MAPTQPSIALLHAVSHWLQRWSDFALAAAAPAAGSVASGALPVPAALSTDQASNVEPPAHWLATNPTSAPPAHWLALLDAHGLTWDADQGIAAQGAPTVAEAPVTAAVQQEQTADQTVEPSPLMVPTIFREGQPSRPDGLPLPSRKMPSDPAAVQDNPDILSVTEALTSTQNPPSPPGANQLDLRQAVAPPSVEPLQSDEHSSALPNPPSNPDAPLVAWLTRLHEGVTALLAATTAGDKAADLPALLRTYAPFTPTPTAITTPAHPEAAMPLPPTIAPGIEPKQPSPLVMPPIMAGESSMPPTPMHQPVASRQNTEPPPATPQRVTRLHLRPSGTEQPGRNQPEDRSKDFSLSSALNRSIESQRVPAASSGKVMVDHPVERTDLSGRLTGQPSPVLMPLRPESSDPDRTTQKQPTSSAATPVRAQPVVQVTRLRIQAPGNRPTAEAAAPAQPAPSPMPPVLTTRSLPVDGTPSIVQPVRAIKTATPLPEAPSRPVEADAPLPGDEQATRLARIEALLTRLLAEQNANGNHPVTPPPAPVSSSAFPPHNRWPALPERAARAERPPQRRHSDPARRRRLEEEQRGRAWNG